MPESSGVGDGRFQALLPSASAAPSCWLVIFVHIEACGFTTLRDHFAQLASVETFGMGSVAFHKRSSPARARIAPALPLGRCSPRPASWFGEREQCTWDKLVRELADGPTKQRRRVLVELPTNAFASSRRDHLELLLGTTRKLRAAWETRGCPLVLASLVREPLEHIAAAYNKFVQPTQSSAPELFGRDFGEWVRSEHVHNPSSRLLLGEPVLSMRARAPTTVPFARLPAPYRTTPADVHARLPELLDALASRFDLVAPLRAFDELFFRLADIIGLRERRYALGAPAARNGSAAARARANAKGDVVQVPRSPALAQPARVRARELDWDMRAFLTTRKLTADRVMYANVSSAWARSMAALGHAARARIGRFRALMRIARREDARVAAAVPGDGRAL